VVWQLKSLGASDDFLRAMMAPAAQRDGGRRWIVGSSNMIASRAERSPTGPTADAPIDLR